jgi:hypothetical protein
MCGSITSDGNMPESSANFIESALKMVLEREGLDEELAIEKYPDSVSAIFKYDIDHFDGSSCTDVVVTLTIKRSGAVAEFEAETYHGGGRYEENNLVITTFNGLRETVLRRCHEVLLGAWKETAEDIQRNINYINDRLAKGDF